MEQIVVILAEVFAAVRTEASRRLIAPFLMLFKLFRASESPDIANLHLLTSLDQRTRCDIQGGRGLDLDWALRLWL